MRTAPILAAAVLLTACGSSGTEPESTSSPTSGDTATAEPVFGHVHGLGVDPADDTLYVASHLGVFRVADGEVELVADRQQDTMGFVVAGPNHFLGSGHPDPDEGLPPSLGLIESKDAGETWQPLSLLGEADLHAIEPAGEAVYAYDSTSQSLIVSTDGQRWSAIAQLLVLLDIAVDPSEPDTVVMTTDRGQLLSASGGAEPSPVYGAPPGLFALDWQADGPLVAVTSDGSVVTSADGETGWDVVGSVGARVEALDVVPGRWHVATKDAILESTDDGETWDVVLEREG
jgi:hypothetical protein